jgi:predicted O-methyltransferase YrrM
MTIRPDRFGMIEDAPVLMSWSERVVLYSTVFGLRPRRSLEIGTHKGGSATIIIAALDDIGAGSLICVDPNPVVAPETWDKISHRATLLSGNSPEILSRAKEAAGGSFDFALIDGDHSLEGVVRDIEGVLPLLADQAFLLFHDAHFDPVKDGIDRMLSKHRARLVDCGMVSVERTEDPDGQPRVCWGGLRMLRFSRRRVRPVGPAWAARLVGMSGRG